MSFNYLEIARAAEIINKELPAEVLSVELVEFPVPGKLTDINLALRLSSKKLIVFSLRSPWTGIFSLPGSYFKPSRMPWMSVFGSASDWTPVVQGKQLLSVKPVMDERIVDLEFEDGIHAQFEMFPARPNWTLHVPGAETPTAWRTTSDKPGPVRPPRPVTATPQTLQLREFESAHGRDWMERAYSYYREQRLHSLLASGVNKGLSQLQARLQQLIKIRGQMESSRSEATKADEYYLKGERLKAIMYEHPKTFRGKRIENIELDPQLTLAENAARYFSKYKKFQRTSKEVEARLGGIEEETKKVTSSIAKMRGFKRQDDESFEQALKRLIEALRAAGLEPGRELGEARPEKPPNKVEKKWAQSGLRKHLSKEGLTIWVGRNHKENEELVIRLARGNDMWLHLKGKPGAHAVIQLSSGKSPSLETLLDAAMLVAYHSGVANHDKAEVDYTFRKFVKRVPGQKEKFLVTYSQNKTLMIKMDEERVLKLIRQQ